MPAGFDLFGQHVLLVEEKNHGDRLQPAVVPYVFEQRQRLPEAILRRVLPQHKVVRGAGTDENYRRHVVKALNPLSSLVTLAAHIEHAVKKQIVVERQGVFYGKNDGSFKPVWSIPL